MKCKSGRHAWIDPVSAERCCSGRWHRAMRFMDAIDDLDPEGRVYCGNGMWSGWVRTPEEVAA